LSRVRLRVNRQPPNIWCDTAGAASVRTMIGTSCVSYSHALCAGVAWETVMVASKLVLMLDASAAHARAKAVEPRSGTLPDALMRP